jgi:Ca2+-binding RTX toxin-like protein
MPAPVKWSLADFELVNTENPEGEPWLAAAPDGRFMLTFFESFASPSAYTDIETRLYSAAGTDTGLDVAPTFSAATTDHQAASAYLPDGRQVFVWTEEPAAGGGNLEDVYATVYVGNLVSIPRFLVAGGAGIQHDPVVAASANGGFAVALADDSVAGGRVTLKFYNNVGTLVNTVLDASAPEGVYTPSGNEDDYRNVEITALANGNYVVTWQDDANFDIFARIFSASGNSLTGLIDIEPGGSSALWPDVTALADGRFLVTYEQTTVSTVRGRIFEADGASSVGPFTITTNASAPANQQVQSAALQDGRFVTVYRNLAGNIEGQVMFADGTPDGGVFAVNSDGLGGKGRPTVATLADGRFAVSWESGAGATATIFTTIFDPREAGLNNKSASSFNDDWQGTGFVDRVYLGTGNDNMSGGAGGDFLFGEAGQDTLNGDTGIDYLYGGAQNDTLNGGAEKDYLYGELGDDSLNGNDGDDQLYGGDNRDTLNGGTGNDRLEGGAGNDTINGEDNNDLVMGGLGDDTIIGNLGLDDLRGDAGNDFIHGNEGNDNLIGGAGADQLFGDAENDTITAGDNDDIRVFGGTGDDLIHGDAGNDILNGEAGLDRLFGGTGNDTLLGGTEADTLIGDAGADRMDGGDGADRLYALGAGDVMVLASNTGNDRVFDFVSGQHDLEIDASVFGGVAGAFAYVQGSAPVSGSAQQHMLYNTDNGYLYIDGNGNAAGGVVAVVLLFAPGGGVPALAAGDILLV